MPRTVDRDTGQLMNEGEDDDDGQALKAAEAEAKAEESESDDDSESSEPATAPAIPALPIEEDKVGHAALKRLLTFETSVESESGGKGKHTDSDLFDENAPSKNALALPLLEKLQSQDGLLARWIGCNRACFALNAMLAVPTATKALTDAIKSGDAASQLVGADAGVGAKALADALGLGESKKVAASKKKAPVKAAPAAKKRKA